MTEITNKNIIDIFSDLLERSKREYVERTQNALDWKMKINEDIRKKKK